MTLFCPDRLQDIVQGFSQHHRSNWVDSDEDDEDDGDEDGQYVQSTPPYYEEP